MKKLVLLIVLLTVSLQALSQTRLKENIWDNTRCRMKVSLTAFQPEGEPRAAVIVCPGGSYFWHDMEAEGIKVAEWLSAHGIAAYVLKYRVAGKFEFVAKFRQLFRGIRHPDMIQDLQRAIQLVRERFDGPVGVMGFSAGGHLVMSSAELFGTNFLEEYEIYPSVSLRPDFVAPIYPVVTLSDRRYVHRRSREGLLGLLMDNRKMQDSLSLEKHVLPDTPPVFLMNCVDDPVVDYHNSILLDSALTAKGIPHMYIQYKTGGHGFGADVSRQNEETAHWQDSFLEWLDQQLKDI